MSHAVNVSACETEGNGVGDLPEPPVGSKGFHLLNDALGCVGRGGMVHISFEKVVGDEKKFLWDGVLADGKLFIKIPDGILFNNSKESFIELLEYADRSLHCDHVVICFRKERSDRVSLIRNFMFLGFKVLPAGHRFVPAASGSVVYMAYSIDDPGEEDSD